jgi:O-antigen chain-terminating methyltransferase
MPVRIPEESPAESGLPPEEILDYFLFEQRFRGTLDEIRERQAIYLDIFRDKQNVLDLGCGRGEFVELLAMHQVPVTGVDANPDMVDFCRERGLNVVLADAFAYLHDCADGSLDGIFSAQVVEHLPPMEAIKLIALAAAKLRPAGVLVVETVNIHCPSTLSSFFLDPTHIRPLPAELLGFMFEQCALKVTGVKYSSPVDGTLPFVLHVSQPTPPGALHYQDYAIIAVK